MLKRLGTLLLVLAVVLAALPGSVAFGLNPPQVTLAVSQTNVAVGSTFTVTVAATGGADVYGSASDIVFDPAVLQLVSTAPGTVVTQGVAADSTFTATPSATLADGKVRATAIALRLGNQSGATGDGTLAVYTMKALAAGSFTIASGSSLNVQMVDHLGQEITYTAPASVTVTLGGPVQPPMITTPVPNTYINTASFNVTGTAGAGTTVIPTIDQLDQPEVTVGAGGTFSFVASVTGEGQHNIRVRDKASGTLSNTVNVILDLTPPLLNVNTISPAVSTYVSGNVSDANWGTLYVQINPTGAPTASDAVTATDGVFSHNLTLEAGATSTVRVTAIDRAGNQSEKQQPVIVPPAGLTVKLQPSVTTALVNNTFTVNVQLQNAQNVGGADVLIGFPADKLEVVDADANAAGVQITKGTILNDFAVKNEANNTAGTVWYASAGQTGFTGTGTFATITLRVKAEGAASIVFSSAEVRDPNDVLLSPLAVDAQVTLVSGGIVTGRINPQSRTSNKAGVKVKVVGENISAITAADGTFTLTGVPQGSKQLLIRFPNPAATTPAYIYYLAKIVDANVIAGQTVTLADVEIRTGDATGDNKVTLSDLLALAKSYGLNSTQPGYDYRADFTGDNKVTLSDLLALASNYGTNGAPIPVGE